LDIVLLQTPVDSVYQGFKIDFKNLSTMMLFNIALMIIFQNAILSSPFADVSGSWEMLEESENGTIKHQILITDFYFTWTSYGADKGEFISTKGGLLVKEGAQLVCNYEFSTSSPEIVGTDQQWSYTFDQGKLVLSTVDGTSSMWSSSESSPTTPLNGTWIFSGRERDGVINRVDNRDQPRKTMKILTGSKFQWIAFNTETKTFFGSGGGSYSAVDGKYKEEIEFFSRDDNRVGAVLEFSFEVKDKDWHHKGKSSSGEPMYEVWSLRF